MIYIVIDKVIKLMEVKIYNLIFIKNHNILF